MKKLLILLYSLAFSTPSVLTAQQLCQDYFCNYKKAQTALNNKQFKEAWDYCKAAKAYPNANVVEADALIYKIFEAQKKIAEAATKTAKTEADNAKREKLKAEGATKRAEKTARAAENTAAFMKMRGIDSTMAMRMMYYNYMHHPENKFTRDIYHQTINDPQAAFLLKILRGHQAEIMSVAYSPNGKTVLTGSQDHTAKLWNVETGLLEKNFVGHTGWVSSVTFSPDGKKIATGSWDSSVKIWDIESGIIERTFIGIHFFGVHTNAIAFSPDSKKILTGGYYGTLLSTYVVAKLWHIESGKMEKMFVGHSKEIGAVAFSPDGKKILTGSIDMTAKLWDIESGKVDKTFIGHRNGVAAVAFSPDGRTILTGSSDFTAKIWDINTLKVLKTFVGHTKLIFSAVFSPDGKKVLTGSSDYTARLWNIESTQTESVFTGHSRYVYGVAFSPDGKKILTGSWDKTARIWDIGSDKTRQSFAGDYRYGDYITTYSDDGKPISAGTYEVSGVVFSPDGKKILSVGIDNTLKIWDIEKDCIEHWAYKPSLFELSQNGVRLEPTDMPQYERDSLDYFKKMKQDSLEHLNLMATWTNTAAYRKEKSDKEEWNQSKELALEQAQVDSLFKIENNILPYTIRNDSGVIDTNRTAVVTPQSSPVTKTDTTALFKQYGAWIDTLKKQTQQSIEYYAPALAKAYNSHAWYGFFLKKFKKCEQDIRAGIAVDSTNKYLYTNLAPALLLQGKFKQAKAEYDKWKNKEFGAQNLPTYREAFLNDLKTFEKAGIIPKEREKDVAAIRKLLEKKE